VNADECLLTRMQEMSLDYHFSVEQEVGSSAFAFFGFNGILKMLLPVLYKSTFSRRRLKTGIKPHGKTWKQERLVSGASRRSTKLAAGRTQRRWRTWTSQFERA
jgi:hypothetical protein